MKLCWDNIEHLRLTKNGVFAKHNNSYVYMESCSCCGKPYLTSKSAPSNFCSTGCAISGERHPGYGKPLSDAHKHKLSMAFTGQKNHFYGKTHSKETKEIISKKLSGRSLSLDAIEKMVNTHIGNFKHTIDYIKLEFEKENYVLLCTKYKGCDSKLEYICPNGHKGFITWHSWQKGNRCLDCYNIARIGSGNPNWKGGISFEPYCRVWSDKEYKSDIRERDGNRCLNPYCFNSSKGLHIHHIDYDKKNCSPQNLITLCRSCNSRANFDRRWHTEWYRTILNKRYGYAY